MLEAAERARADANNHNDMGVGGAARKIKVFNSRTAAARQ